MTHHKDCYYVIKEDKDLIKHLQKLQHTDTYLKGLTIIYKDMLYTISGECVQHDSNDNPYAVLIKYRQSKKYY